MAFVLLVESIERQVLVERQCAITAAAAGAEDVEIPDLHTQLARFEAALLREDEVSDVDSDRLVLLRALGLT